MSGNLPGPSGIHKTEIKSSLLGESSVSKSIVQFISTNIRHVTILSSRLGRHTRLREFTSCVRKLRKLMMRHVDGGTYIFVTFVYSHPRGHRTLNIQPTRPGVPTDGG